MMEAVRNGAWAKIGGWVNPYVTNGLIAMWDGEWNARGGVHDPNATVWKDLIGDLNSNLLGNSLFAYNYCEIRGKSGMTYVDISEFTLPPPPNSIEIIFGFSESKLSYNRILSNGNFRLYPRSDIGFAGDGSYVPCLNAFGVDTYNYGSLFKKDLVPDYTPFSISISIDTECDWKINGYDYAQTPIAVKIPYSGFVLGSDPDGKRGQDCRIYCLRFYDRKISTQDAAANYAIDKARFNLP